MLRALAKMALMGWAVVGAVSLAAAVLYGGLSFAVNPTPWNVPGDPPLFDLLIFAAAFTLVMNAPVWLLASRFWSGPAGTLSVLSRTCSILTLVLLLTAVAGIMERHGPRWADVRSGIRQLGDEIAIAAGGRDKILTQAEFEELKERFVATPVPVRLPGFGVVSLKMAHGVYPFVGVDFGSGANALFNPRTMMCMYSD